MKLAPSLRGRKVLWALALLAVYFITASLLTWPLIQRLNTHLIGRTSDTLLHYWNGWWVGQALITGSSPFQTGYLNFPSGASLVTQNIAWFNVIPWLILKPIVGGIAAYNLTVLLSLAFAGFGLYLLAYELLGNRQAAFLGGLIYLAWPYRLSQLDHPNLLGTFWIAIFLLFLVRTLRDFHWRDALLAGIALSLVGYTRWQLLIPTAFMGLVYLAGSLAFKKAAWKQALPRLGFMGLIAFLALLPPAFLLAREQLSSDLAADIFYEVDEQTMTVDLLAYLTPSSRHFLLKSLTEPLYDRYYADRSSGRRFPAYIGLSVLILAVIGLVKRWRESWVWLVMALMLGSFAAGMALRINGRFFPTLPTLYKLLAPLEVARLMREPERFALFIALPVSLLAAYGWAALLSYPRISRWSRPLALLLSVIILFEFTAIPAQSIDVSFDKTVLQQLAEEPGDFAILNIPLRYRFSKEYMFDQTIHQRPILQGHISREPENLYDYITDSETLAQLPELPVDLGRMMAELHADGIGYLLLSKYLMEEPAWRLWERHMPYDPVYEDERYAAYATAPQYGRELDPPSELPAGIGPVDWQLATFCSREQLTITTAVTWGSTAVLPVDYHVLLNAKNEKSGDSITMSRPVTGEWPTSQWPPNSISRQAYMLTLPPEQGPFTLSLSLVDPQDGNPAGNSFDLGRVDPPNCTIIAPEARRAEVDFGPSLHLLAYQVEAGREELKVHLYWTSRERLPKDYKFYAHLFDPKTGQLAAQVDAMPLDWTLPTSSWRSGELVADELRLEVKGLPPGSYRLAIGVYEAASGQRVIPEGSAVNPSLTIMEDGRLLLPEDHEVK